MRKAQVFVAALAVMLTACAGQPLPYPRATTGPYIEQMKLQSASHWDLLARHEASLIVASLPDFAMLHVRNTGDNSTPFNEVYHQLLTSSLVRDGANVLLAESSAAYQVEYSVQTVTHHRRERQRLIPGTATAFWLASEVLENAHKWKRPELVLLPVAVGVDLWNLLPFARGEATEVVITTRVHDGRRIVVSDSRVYYFNAADIQHYLEGRVFPVVGALSP